MQRSRSFLSIFFLFFLSSLIARAQNKPASVTLTVVGQKDSLATLYTTNMLSMDTLLFDSGRLNSEGKVCLTADLQRPIFMTVLFGKTYVPVLLEPGTQLDIRFDEKDPKDKLAFAGSGAGAARAIADYEKVRQKYEVVNGKSAISAEESDFVSRGTNLQSELNAVYQKLTANKNISPTALHLLSQYKEETIKFFYNKYAQFRYSGAADPAMPASMKKVVSLQLSADKASLLSNMYPYGLMLNAELLFRIHSKIGEMMGKPPYDSTSTLEWVEIADQELMKMDYPPHLISFFRIKNLDYWVRSDGISPAVQHLHEELVKDPSQEPFIRAINQSFAMWENLLPGKPAPNFSGTTPEGKQIALSDLQGKLVYVDVWATWCKPCISEFPKSKELMQKFDGDEKVAFLFVSIDENTAKWKKMVTEDAVPKGVQMHQPQNKQADAIWENYHLWGITRYILVNKDGTILQTHAPRPSSGKVPELLRKYI